MQEKQLIYNLQEQFKSKSKNLITYLDSLIFFLKLDNNLQSF